MPFRIIGPGAYGTVIPTPATDGAAFSVPVPEPGTGQIEVVPAELCRRLELELHFRSAEIRELRAIRDSHSWDGFREQHDY